MGNKKKKNPFNCSPMLQGREWSGRGWDKKKDFSPLKKILPSEVKKIVPETDKIFFGVERLSPRPLIYFIMEWDGMEII